MVNYELRKMVSDNNELLSKFIDKHPQMESAMKELIQNNRKLQEHVEGKFTEQIRGTFS